MKVIWPHRLPTLFYRAFVRDSIRLYQVLPSSLKLRSWIVLGGQILAAVTETLTLLVISVFALTIAAPEEVAEHFLIKPVLKLWPSLAQLTVDPRNMLIFVTVLMVLFVIIKGATNIFSSHQVTVLAQKVSVELARQTLADYLNRDYFWHLEPKSQDTIHLVLNRNRLSTYVFLDLLLFSNNFCCIALFTCLAVIEPKLTLISVVVFSVASVVIYGLIRHRVDRVGQKIYESVMAENRELMAVSQGIREIIIYGRQNTALGRIIKIGRDSLEAKAFHDFSGFLPTQCLEVVGFGTVGLVIISMISSGLPLAEIVTSASLLMLTAWRILPAINRCLSFAVQLRGLRSQAMAYLNLAENNSSGRDLAGSKNNREEEEAELNFTHGLSLKNVSFTYPGGAGPVIKDLSVSILKGQSIGLIGPSGSGKTTLALLLSGLFSPQEGEFLVDGQPLVTQRQKNAYFNKLGFVPQNPLLIDGTLAENVAFRQWGQEIDLNRVRQASREAAMDFIETDPQGLLRPIVSGQKSLSGGQAQRVAIARALYSKPDIIIFDEATSALDLASENIIKRTLENTQSQMTCIIIAHRLTTVEGCDELLWLEDGRIKMAGPPETVIEIYKKFMTELSQATDRTTEGPLDKA
ncbi:MAG: ABC transporter ATP-binding protein/permease [Deltaproteobacteria bacterium]|nr:ABC transporter ATP-binding protein/permease [Deltaproteobacteria bacterium]